MKRKPLKVIHFLRSRCGNAVAEFAVTTAMMATLAATAAPKLSEGSKENTMLSIRESADLYKEVRQLSSQRDILKDEIFELLVAQNEILMQKVANSHLQNSTLDYLGAAGNNLHEPELSDQYESEAYDFEDDGETDY